MLSRADNLLARLSATEVASGARQPRGHWRSRARRRRVQFDRDVEAAHKRFRQSIPTFLHKAGVSHVLTAPLAYSLIIPFALADLWVTLYQWVCFPVYGIAKVRRRDYVVIDRHKLGYLNAIEKVNCAYCSYANGLIAYIREIAARTERYWCPIKHGGRVRAAHTYYSHFFEYGDAPGYRGKASVPGGVLNRPRRLGRGRRTGSAERLVN